MTTQETYAELEKFIEGRLEFFLGKFGRSLNMYRSELKNELNEVAKRAREKAIEECKEASETAFLHANTSEEMSELMVEIVNEKKSSKQ